MGVVLRLKPADVEDVSPGLQAEPRQRPVIRHRLEVRPVGEIVGLSTIRLRVVVLDDLGISYQMYWQVGGGPRAEAIVRSANSIPLRPLPLKTVDIEDNSSPQQA